MSPFLCTIFLLGLSSLATALNFTQVFEWPDELDYEWPSEASRKHARRNGTFIRENIYPRYMAVYGPRIFLSLNKDDGIPVTLVTLPTSSASSVPPKFTPFPSWDMHLNGKENCNKIHQAEGLQVDSVGRLWVLDQGNSVSNCSSKLWIFNLNNNETELIHRFSIHDFMHDLVIDETPNGTFGYITLISEPHILVFSLERKASWTVDTQGMEVSSIALSSPKKEPRTLYLSKYDSNELFSISVAALRNGTRAANPEFIGNWTAKAYRMLMDNHETKYAAFLWKNYLHAWNTSQPFQEQRVYDVAGLESFWPFTFALDQNGTLWMTVFEDERKPRCRLLKAALAANSAECATPCHKNDAA